ncbi:hypothetical protein MBOL_09380 [Mycobacteroides abscessus subsp. bolletii BD]|nr:hypothetical protein MBOL_09380 [Mycobacteroides abscessus subsp. bolletii BD]
MRVEFVVEAAHTHFVDGLSLKGELVGEVFSPTGREFEPAAQFLNVSLGG